MKEDELETLLIVIEGIVVYSLSLIFRQKKRKSTSTTLAGFHLKAKKQWKILLNNTKFLSKKNLLI